MRRVISILVACLPVPLVLVTGCPGEAPPPRTPSPVASPSVEASPSAPPRSYTIADPDALPKGTAIAVDGGAFGVVIEGARVLVRGDDLRVARDVTRDALVAVDRVPAWLGGGFLFRTMSALYASETFDGALRPITTIPGVTMRVAFGPRGALLRTSNGSRGLYDLASGAALPIAPVGLVDVVTLADGRAAALAEGGRLMISTDRGERWADATARLGAIPTSVVEQSGEIWIDTDATKAFRLDPGGALREFDSIPSAVPQRLRARDPVWRGVEAPLVAAVRRGARLDDGSVIVAAAGDVVRVDLRTGAVTSVARGRLPPDLPCEAMRAGEDVIAVCALARRPSIVVTHLADGHPSIERTFPVEGPFFAGDDGSLVFGGSCDGSRMRVAACVRDAKGAWHDHGVDAALVAGDDAGAKAALPPSLDAGADAGAGALDPSAIVRWVVRDGGRPIALVGGKSPGTFDPESGALRAWKKEADAKTFPSDILRALDPIGVGSKRSSSGVILDRRWSMGDGVLRGWLDNGQLVKVRSSGEVERSPFVFLRTTTAGAFGFAVDPHERSFQSIDHGETWTEVASAPVPRLAKLDKARCSALGCDLGAWLRLGWDDSPPPVAPEPPPPVSPPPRAPRAALPELTCVAAGEERFTKLTATSDSPEDLGLGARRLPVGKELVDRTTSYHHRFYSRGVPNPMQTLAPNGDPEGVPRAVLHGWAAQFQGSSQGGVNVLGPSRGAEAFHRELTFLEPFDADGAVRAAGFGLRDLDVAARSAGAALEDLFTPEGPEIEALAPILPLDPAGASGLVVSVPWDGGQLLGTITGGARPHFKASGARIVSTTSTPVSAVELGGGELAVLMVGSYGEIEILKVGAAGISLIHHLPALVDQELNPANSDALAIGAQGALALLRTPSGSQPPSAADPALLLPLGSGPVVALAPWSTLTAADDPVCRGATDGYRAVVQIAEPWLHVRGGRAPDSLAPGAAMLARVRWGATRVCLEAVEVPDGVRMIHQLEELETSVVARFTGKSPAAGRVGMMPGAELWRPLSCKLLPP
jgi:hypothetical protein